jgi:hypothetical protein
METERTYVRWIRIIYISFTYKELDLPWILMEPA